MTRWVLLLTLLLIACEPPGLASLPADSSLSAVPYQLILQVKETRLLPLLQRRFGAQVQDQLQVDGQSYHLLALDPERVTQALAELLPTLPSTPLAWTEAAAENILSQHPQMLQSLALNQLPELPQSDSGPEFNDLAFEGRSQREGWWRRATQVEAAWNYSIGTGARAAYIDLGFVRDHPELEQRLLIMGDNNHSEDHHLKQPGNIALPVGDHGTASLLVGFAERDNHLPSVGVAPNAQVMPYVAASVWGAARALKAAASHQPDVIGMNFAFPLFPAWEAHKNYQSYQVLKAAFAELGTYSRLPIVVPAHNYAEPVSGGVRTWVPVAWAAEMPQIIGVGGVQINAEQTVSAWFSPQLLTGINARGSNYGPGLIWAPAVALDIASTRPDGLEPGSMNGTSASCPFMTAAIALIKSRLPELETPALHQILLNSAQAVAAGDLLQRPGATVPLVQVAKALEQALQSQGQNPAAYRAQKFSGRLHWQRGQGYMLQSTTGQHWDLLPSQVFLRPEFQHPLQDKAVDVWGWQGLPGMQTNQLEVLKVRPQSSAQPSD